MQSEFNWLALFAAIQMILLKNLEGKGFVTLLSCLPIYNVCTCVWPRPCVCVCMWPCVACVFSLGCILLRSSSLFAFFGGSIVQLARAVCNWNVGKPRLSRRVGRYSVYLEHCLWYTVHCTRYTVHCTFSHHKNFLLCRINLYDSSAWSHYGPGVYTGTVSLQSCD